MAKQTTLRPGEVRILDGGVGTELQRRGVHMAAQAWCGPAAIENIDTLMEVHADYIAAGADIITANTYATSRPLLAQDGLSDRFEEINRASIGAAHRARAQSGRDDVLVAGSLSHRGPIEAGTDRPATDSARVRDEIAEGMAELAGLLREEGCDLILLEMMYDPALVPLAFEAATGTGLPVWAGFSARRGADGRVLGFDPRHDTPLAEIAAAVRDWPVAAAGIMHTPSDLVGDALDVVRGLFDGPLTAYPDSGYFKSPNWQFEDVIRPEALHEFAAGWVAQGVQAVGGCCGLSPEHIAALPPLKRGPEP